MPPLVCGMLATAAHTSELGQVLRFLGRYYEMRFSRAVAILHAAVVPLLALAMGVLVAWMELTVLMPLIALIDNLALPAKGL
jgi:type II secretory pathway component PulF